ncbi:MAG: helix-turn-helix transcriptional regulator [Ruminococcaceae bacterium]|nr:helix-turn-helix transcriptional regulator [Oscillospiraceae bacterium]
MYTAQTTKDRIRQICKDKNINAKNMLESCGLGFNAIQQITNAKGMASFSLAKIADYLGCSVDYLLGRTDDPESHIDKFSFLDERDHELVTSIIEKSYQRSTTEDKQTDLIEGMLEQMPQTTSPTFEQIPGTIAAVTGEINKSGKKKKSTVL